MKSLYLLVNPSKDENVETRKGYAIDMRPILKEFIKNDQE